MRDPKDRETRKVTKAPIHYVTNTLESQTPTSICGIRTSHAASTENALAVTCQRCLKALNRKLPFTETPPVAVPTNNVKGEAMEEQVVEEVEVIDAVVQMGPVETQEVLQEPVLVAAEVYKIVSDGVELDEAAELTDATKKAVQASQALGDSTTVSVVLNGVIKHQYKDGHHLARGRGLGLPKVSSAGKKANGKVTNIADAPKKAAKEPKPAPAPKEAKPKKSAEATNDCICGCGVKTRNSFAPGHDARVHGWMKKIAKGEMKLNQLEPITKEYVKAHA